MKSKPLNNASFISVAILIVYGVLAVLMTVKLQNVSREHEIVKLTDHFQIHKRHVEQVIEQAFVECRSLRSAFLLMRSKGIPSRQYVNDLLRATTENNQNFFGTWSVWEPNAFDGRDEVYVGSSGSNEEGRFMPYWHWSSDSVLLENCLLSEESLYYLLPKTHRKEFMLEPYTYPVDGEDQVLLSVVIPIVVKDVFLGVVGIDFNIKEFNKDISGFGVLDEESLYMITGGGKLVVHPEPAKIGGEYDSDPLKHSFGEVKLSTDSVKVISQKKAGGVILAVKLAGHYVQGDWVLLLAIDRSSLNTHFGTMKLNLLVLLGVSLALFFLLIFSNSEERKSRDLEKEYVKDQLSKSNARLASHIESTEKTSIYSLDRKLKYTGFNSNHHFEMNRIFGVTPKVGAYMPQMIPEAIRGRYLENMKRALKGEHFETISIFDESYYKQIFNPVYDECDEIIGLTSNVINVTDIIKSERELEKYKDRLEELVEERTRELTEQKEFLQQIVDQIPVMMFVRDGRGKYVLLNNQTAKFYQKPVRELIGMSVLDLHHDASEASDFLKEDKLLLSQGGVLTDENVSLIHGGERKEMIFTKSRILVKEVGYILGIHVDITPLKRTEKALKATNEKLQKAMEDLKTTQLRLFESEKMASLGTLTAGLAHEINNPINYVAGNVEPIKQNVKDLVRSIDGHDSYGDEKSPIILEIYALLDGVAEGSKRVINLIRDLRDFSGDTNRDFVDLVNVNESIKATVNLVRFQPRKNIKFKLNLNDIPRVKANINKLKQVFLNMLTNSCQAIHEQGEIMVETSLESSMIKIEIKDSGNGVRSDLVSRIFDPFVTTKDVGEGTGLGLAISYNIIKELNGFIDLKETSTSGTTFVIWIPPA